MAALVLIPWSWKPHIQVGGGMSTLSSSVISEASLTD